MLNASDGYARFVLERYKFFFIIYFIVFLAATTPHQHKTLLIVFLFQKLSKIFHLCFDPVVRRLVIGSFGTVRTSFFLLSF